MVMESRAFRELSLSLGLSAAASEVVYSTLCHIRGTGVNLIDSLGEGGVCAFSPAKLLSLPFVIKYQLGDNETK